jgi:hypothetical protein
MATGPLGETPGTVGEAAKVIQAGTSPLFAAKGINDISAAGLKNDPEAWEQRLQGGAELSGGAAGVTENAPVIYDAAGNMMRPLARATGAGIERVGRFSRTPISDMSFRGFPVTPARLAGGMAGAKLGALSGQPEGVLAAGIGGVALGDRAAQGLESLGSKIKVWGGGEPLSPLQVKSAPIPRVPRPTYKGIRPTIERMPQPVPTPSYEGIAEVPERIPGRIPEPTYKGIREEETPQRITPPPLRWTLPAKEASTEAAVKPRRVPEPTYKGIIPRESEQPRIIQPGGSDVIPGTESRIIAGQRGLYEGRARPAGDPMMWTNEQILDFAERGDPDAIRALPIRGLTMRGRPTSYADVPLPKK